MRLTAKAVGSAGADPRHVPVGSRAIVEGPYGAFTSLRRTRSGALLIAGGVGITPVRALLEEEPAGDVVVLYRVRRENDALLVDETRALVAGRGGAAPAHRPHAGGEPAVRAGQSPCPGSRHDRTRRVRLRPARDNLGRAQRPAQTEGSPPANARRAVRPGLSPACGGIRVETEGSGEGRGQAEPVFGGSWRSRFRRGGRSPPPGPHPASARLAPGLRHRADCAGCRHHRRVRPHPSPRSPSWPLPSTS
ncbi:flavin-dependent oxidoreductase [Streptomyces sp. Ag82_O1-15]|nr:flavin-dependent oxidoreductase [Streptomyces sp. Ag82_O1-15]